MNMYRQRSMLLPVYNLVSYIFLLIYFFPQKVNSLKVETGPSCPSGWLLHL